MKNLSALTECLVPFIAKKVTTRLLWTNNLDNAQLKEVIQATSYLIPENQRHSVFDARVPILNNEKIFYAERYGGDAISLNGGGARCGFDGRWQVKGIGANALVGQGAKQVDGELTLTGAVLEAIWGGLLAKLLPYGVVPNKAILLTEIALASRTPSVSSPIHSHRVLLVRESAVRPAHFCRAPYYQPHADMRLQQTDSARVERQIAIAPSLLPRPAKFEDEQWAALEQEERALYGLCELAQRLATQIAWCRSRHLVMMTSPSNCDMQGRLLDFHGVRSVFPVERREAGSSYVQYNKLSEDAPLLLQGVQDLSFYLAKFLFGAGFLATAQQAIDKSFSLAYRKTCFLENLGTVGFDKEFLHSLHLNDEMVALADRLQRIFDLSAGMFTQRLGLSYGDEHPAISLLHQLIDDSSNAAPEKNPKTAGERFSLAFHQLYTDYLHKSLSQGKTAQELRKAMKRTVARKLASRAFMSRGAISQEIASWQGEPEVISERLHAYQIRFESLALQILK
ncbi:hypothetical protein AB3X31_07160 [Raoultella terrigena]|uniref:hypothetical protein n=1 Tax=Raoultella terrigena TaxID=577 RepID=UPI000F9C97EC|nr:hypothetical protein [Raoultella terrigena]ROR94587.1 hypothetical protein EDF76_4605 [Raoultella terrigena]